MSKAKRTPQLETQRPDAKPVKAQKGEPKPNPREAFAFDYSLVVSKAQLTEIRLVKSSFAVETDFFKHPGERELGFDRLVHTYPLQDGVSLSTFDWETTAEGPAGKRVLDVRATFLVLYSGLAGCSDVAVAAFVERVGTLASYPYFRGLVAQYDWAAYTHLPPMPVITSSTEFSKNPKQLLLEEKK